MAAFHDRTLAPKFQGRLLRGTGPCHVLTSEALLVRLSQPSSVFLPSLSDALARRAGIFGPVELGEPPAPSLGLLARCGAALRLVADFLEPQGRMA